MSGESQQQLHVVLFPVMAHGHMLPILDIAKLFAARGVKATIITTPLNVPVCAKAIKGSKQVGVGPPMIDIEVFQFPSAENGLPEGCEILHEAIKLWLLPNFMKAIYMLREQLEQYLDKARPDYLVSDMFLPWTTESAAKFNIPRMVFHGTCYFARCATEIVEQHKPFTTVSSDDEPFIIPFLPHEIQFTRLQIPDYFLWKEEETETESHNMIADIRESELKSFGVIFNSFYELEPEYADFYTEELGRRAWHIGPVSLCNRSIKDKAQRGEDASTNENECLKWLDLKKQDSVLYICSGSIAHYSASQLYEISMALEASQQEFIWVVKGEEDFPPGFEQRTKGKGLILRGWAPQLLILEHQAIGAFVTHCGWNSILEGISAGVPMVTWPIFGEQFYNEKLVTEILNIGVPVGVKKWNLMPQTTDLIKKDMIERALHEVMKGEKTQERRNKAKKLKEMAQKAVQENGSSYSDLGALINELRHYHGTKLHLPSG